MQRKSKYYISQASLEFFANTFNSIPDYPNIKGEYIKDETFDNDGWFLDIKTGKTIGFDGEIRDKYFENGRFAFDTLGQYERKIKKPSIDISIQADKDCYAIIVGGHEDFLNEEIKNIQLSNDASEFYGGKKENGQTRETTHFRIYTIDELVKFKKLISLAFELNKKNHEVFSCMEDTYYSVGDRYYHTDRSCSFMKGKNISVIKDLKNLIPCKKCIKN